MREWTNPYNPFNSMKALIWREHFEGMASGNFLPPVSVDTDPSNRCNLACLWCNAVDNMKSGRHDIPAKHLLRLADFYAEWGVKSTCVAGGGEPLLNRGTGDFLLRLAENGVEAGVITNGILMGSDMAKIIAKTCRWIGVSVDAATPEVYSVVKGLGNVDVAERMLKRVLGHIVELVDVVSRSGAECDIAFKYLLHPANATEIFEAAKLARSIGVKDFHLRPVGWDNLSKTQGQAALEFAPLLPQIDEQIEQAMELEDGHFRFFGIRHKFKADFQRKVNFSKCWAAPLLLTFGSDGKCHLCFDMRGNPDMMLCGHDPDPREVLDHWGSDRHKAMLDAIDPKECPRCTFGPYNEMVEQVFIKDGMCRYFP